MCLVLGWIGAENSEQQNQVKSLWETDNSQMMGIMRYSWPFQSPSDQVSGLQDSPSSHITADFRTPAVLT